MKKKPKQPPSDPNELAASVVERLTESEPHSDDESSIEIAQLLERAKAEGKDPLAVLLGRRGGKIGGAARRKALSKRRRKEIAQKAAISRWSKKPTRSDS